MGFFNRIIYAGSTDIQDESLKSRVTSSNLVALLLLVVAGTYIPITYYFVEPMILIPVFGVLIAILAIALNFAKLTFISRFTIAIAPVTLPGIYHAVMVPIGDPSLIPSVLITFAFALVPFVVFKIDEVIGWLPSFIYGAIWVIGFDDLKNYFEIDAQLDYSFLKDGGVFAYLTSTLGVVFGAGSVVALAMQNRNSEKRSLAIQNEMAASQEEMENSQLELQKTLEEIEIKKLEEEKRMWANDGMVKFTEILRNFTGEDLYAEIISELVKYVGAKQGKVFRAIEQNGQRYLQLEGTYAYDRFKFEVDNDGVIEPGDGLVGEAFQEGDVIHLTEIPDDYTSITSGLGEANPKAILIFPLMNEEVIEGIIELASFHEFEEFQIDFLSKVGVNIATTFAREQINTRTATLLEESKQQTEMMQQQEEEMRQNMEEMQATQDMMDSREEELLSEIKKLKQLIK